MRSSDKCPKCGCDDVAGPHFLVASYGAGSSLVLDLPQRTATLIGYTCAECGYTEVYSDRKGLQNIRKYGRFPLPDSEVEPGHCKFCGAEVSEGMSICTTCHAPLED
ncbi:hypothetical protein EU538_04940 [Candidatus Thorarchaeota archaeon]|nr:MAG: hypothetical protein EU538_04940 [Candidatus Thorarchaeota archaeon]